MRHARLVIASSVVVTAIAVPLAVRQQPQGDPFSTEIRPVKDGLYVIPGYDGAVTGGNVAVRVTNDGVIIVDDRLPPSSAQIAGKVRSVTAQPIKYMVSSHHHGDHTGGHPEFIKVAEIIAHRNNRENMVRGNQSAPPRVVFTDQASVFLGGIEVQARYLGRGHTNGDAVTYFPDLRAVHTGDLVVWGKRTDGSQLTPFVDRRNGGSLNEWVGTVEKLLEIDFDAAIPGHGPVLTKDQVRTFHRNLITLRQRLIALVKSGGTRKDLDTKLKTDDLSWPFPPERLDELWNEFGTPR
jgi:cyclase